MERRVFGFGPLRAQGGGHKGQTHNALARAKLALSDFDDSAVSNEVVDAKLDGWELQGAQIRKEARRLQRQGAAET